MRAFAFHVVNPGLVVFAGAVLVAAGEEKKPGAKPSREALRELGAAVQLLNAGQLETGIQALERLIETHANDAAAGKAAELLLDHGVGKEIRIVLDDRKVFRGGFKMKDGDVLRMAESALAELRPHYKNCPPFFTQTRLKVVFYDSQARFREAGGSVTSGGHFQMARADFERRELEGEIEWHFPKYAATLKDRQTSMKGLLYHELTHYLNAISFGGALPGVFEEGIAEYLASRLNKEYYQYHRTTDRERTEAAARNSLNSITAFDDFVAFLSGSRGFGEGGVMISRWYGLCYSLIDFFEEGKIGQSKSSFGALLSNVQKLAARAQPGKRPPRLNAKSLCEQLAKDAFGCDLRVFHKALVQHILQKYRQR